MSLEASTHPNPLPNLHHRKIELQSPLDLTYLQSNLSTSAQQKLDLHFPPSAYRPPPPAAKPADYISLDGAPDAFQSQHQAPSSQALQQAEEDPLRARVRSIVDHFLHRTWGGASHSISINGLDAHTLPTQSTSSETGTSQADEQGEREGMDFTYTPYDARLQSKVASLYSELEALTAQVSKLRREAPKQGAEGYAEVLRREMGKDEERWVERMEDVKREGEKERGVELEAMRDGWYEDVKEVYEKGVGELGRIAGLGQADGQGGGSLTETVGKVQRARTVAMEFE